MRLNELEKADELFGHCSLHVIQPKVIQGPEPLASK